jgi:CheY-like chemotaxis protein
MSKEILYAVGDMFFASKIKGTADQLGIPAKPARSIEALIESAKNGPAMIVLDLNNGRFDPIAALRQLKADETLRQIPVIGFLSHVQVDLQKEAEEAGCDQILPRSKFTAYLADIITGNYPPL